MRLSHALVIIVVEKVKRPRIGLDHGENIRSTQRLRNAVHHAHNLPKLLEPTAVLGMTLHHVLTKHTRGPAPELNAATRLNSIADRDDDV